MMEIRSVAMSTKKTDFFKALCLNVDDPWHCRLYQLMNVSIVIALNHMGDPQTSAKAGRRKKQRSYGKVWYRFDRTAGSTLWISRSRIRTGTSPRLQSKKLFERSPTTLVRRQDPCSRVARIRAEIGIGRRDGYSIIFLETAMLGTGPELGTYGLPETGVQVKPGVLRPAIVMRRALNQLACFAS